MAYSHRMLAHRMLAAAPVLAAMVCCGSPAEDVASVVARPIMTLDLAADPVALVDVLDLSHAGGFQSKPVGRLLRPIEVLEVLACDRLRLRTDRGVETVRVHGLGGADDRMPREVRDYFDGPGRAAVEAWLSDPRGAVYESSLERYEDRGAVAGPCYADAEGLRLVTLVRLHPNDGDDPVELRLTAIARGWAHPSHPFGDNFSIDSRTIYPIRKEGYGALPIARELAAQLQAEQEALMDMPPEELQELGARLQADIALSLGWEPAADPVFVQVDVDVALKRMSELIVAQDKNLKAWAEAYAERIRAEAKREGREVETTIKVIESDVPALAASRIEGLHAFAPDGPTTYLVRKGELSRSQIESLLVHEIMHQYQEEVAGSDYAFPDPVSPIELGEAHAEYLAIAWRSENLNGHESCRAADYQNAARHFAAIMETLELTADELYLKYLSDEWEGDPWKELRDFQTSLQEFLFKQCQRTEFRGLDFAIVEGTGLSVDNGPVVEIVNNSGATFRGQFHGVWPWTLSDDREGTVTASGPPFNLVLPGGASVKVRIGHADLWAEYPPKQVIGLFSPTP